MDHDKVAVSFVVPVYNVAPYLDECLRSLCGQTLDAIEVVCVDDGSTDGSSDVLARWAAADGRVRVLSQPNSGVGHARNAGLAAARGTYVCFVDGDDYLDDQAAQELVSEAERSGADIVVFGAISFPDEVQWVYEMFGPRDVVRKDAGCDIVLTERGSIPSAANKLYRASLLKENGLRFNEALVLGEDTSLQFLAFPLASCVAFVSKRYYHYRFNRTGSAVTEGFKDRSDQLGKHLDVLCYIADEWQRRGYLKGREGAFLESIAFIFYDIEDMNFCEQVRFSEDFARVFDARFSESDLKGIYPYERWLYEFMLGLGAQGADDATRRRIARRHWGRVSLYRAARSCKHAAERIAHAARKV